MTLIARISTDFIFLVEILHLVDRYHPFKGCYLYELTAIRIGNLIPLSVLISQIRVIRVLLLMLFGTCGFVLIIPGGDFKQQQHAWDGDDKAKQKKRYPPKPFNQITGSGIGKGAWHCCQASE